MNIQVFRSGLDFDWARIQCREGMGEQYELFFPACLMRVFEVMAVADRMSAQLSRQPTVKGVAKTWSECVNQSSMAEKVTDSYVETVMGIRKKILAHPECLRLLLEAEGEFGIHTPWQAVYIMEVMARKVGNHDNANKLVWLIDTINKLSGFGKLDKAKISMRTISGKGQADNKGYCDMLQYGFKAFAEAGGSKENDARPPLDLQCGQERCPADLPGSVLQKNILLCGPSSGSACTVRGCGVTSNKQQSASKSMRSPRHPPMPRRWL